MKILFQIFEPNSERSWEFEENLSFIPAIGDKLFIALADFDEDGWVVINSRSFYEPDEEDDWRAIIQGTTFNPNAIDNDDQ